MTTDDAKKALRELRRCEWDDDFDGGLKLALDLLDREPLVQEVIRLRQALEAKLAADDYGSETIRLSDALWEAHGKLAEWKP